MPWAVRFGDGRQVAFDDLPVKFVADVAEKAGVHWFDLVAQAPARNLLAADILVRAIADREGVTLPDSMSWRQLLELIVEVPDDLPDVWEDGTPKVEGGPTTR